MFWIEILKKVLNKLLSIWEAIDSKLSKIKGIKNGKIKNPIPVNKQFKEKRKKYKTFGIKKPIKVRNKNTAIKEKIIQKIIRYKRLF